MPSPFRNRNSLTFIALLSAGIVTALLLFWTALGTVWTTWDHQILDRLYSRAVQYGYGPAKSPHIAYILITDETYQYFGKNHLDRADMARLNGILKDLGVRAVVYDIIFSHPSRPSADRIFTASIRENGRVYLPVGLDRTPRSQPFRWGKGPAFERLNSDYLKKPMEMNPGNPYHATRSLMQYDDFAAAAKNSGQICSVADTDGVYRHIPALIKIDDRCMPSLALSVFLDWVDVPLNTIQVTWGEEIVIPADKKGLMNREVRIPIDDRGLVFVPFVQVWGREFPMMGAHDLIQYHEDEYMRGNLADEFEEKFVFIGDISSGIADSGYTTLQEEVPLIVLHTALLNGLLHNQFYRKWPFSAVLCLIAVSGLCLAAAAAFRSNTVLYGLGFLLLAGLPLWAFYHLIRFVLVPAATIGGSIFLLFLGLIIGLQLFSARERAFIKNAFSKYVPEKVVDELIDSPHQLKLGGEEQVVTMLFSDLAGFTGISENMPPPELVQLLNSYLTEMTEIILAEGGIIDKYEGDAIMAEFGMPIPSSNHADQAVHSALKMQQRLRALRAEWAGKGLPQLTCRIGINTGPVIVGNMGSRQVFDYTVIGDDVNLASRLEGANKQYHTDILISEATRNHLTAGLFATRMLDVVKVKGKSKAVTIFEVIGLASEPMRPEDRLYYQRYHDAFHAYLSRNFQQAEQLFSMALVQRPEDVAARLMMDRIRTVNPVDLPMDWDGSVTLTSK
ncbi:MAG: CHASE2 domain-containing protein [Thermodesulfobacteriota bacterium]